MVKSEFLNLRAAGPRTMVVTRSADKKADDGEKGSGFVTVGVVMFYVSPLLLTAHDPRFTMHHPQDPVTIRALTGQPRRWGGSAIE